MTRCGAPTADGTPCRRPVKRAGQRCFQHRGFAASRTSSRIPASRPNVPTRPSPAMRRSTWEWDLEQSPTSARSKQSPQNMPASTQGMRDNQRVVEAGVYCADLLSVGWKEAVADRVSGYAETTWSRLLRTRRRRHCKALARIAAALLKGQLELHRLAGRFTGWFAGLLGADDISRAFAEELASNIPLGVIDAKTIAVARGIQVTGILLCIVDGRELTRCQCFIDLALAETKERVRQILIAATSGWASLGQFAPRPSDS